MTRWVVVALVGSLAGWWFASTRAASGVGSMPLVHRVRRTTAPLVVRAGGEFEPADEEPVTVPRDLTGVIDELAPEGRRVEPGELLMLIRTRDMEERVRRSRLEELQKEKEIQKFEREDREKRAQEQQVVEETAAKLDHDKRLLELLEEGKTENEVERIEIQIRRAELEHERQKRLTDVQTELRARGFLAELTYQEQLTALEKARLDLQKQRNLLAMAREGARSEERRRLEASVDKWRQELLLARSNAGKEQEVRRLKTEKARAEIETARARASESLRVLESARITAATTGTVIHHGDFWGRTFKTGSQVWPGSKVLSLARSFRLEVQARVREGDVKRVAVGQPVVLDVAGSSLEDVRGRVSHVGQSGEPEDAQFEKGVKIFPVTIEVGELPAGIRAGILVTATIEVENRTGLLRVPLDTLESGGETSSVRRWSHDRVEDVEIAPILRDDDHVYLEEGLEEGDQLLFRKAGPSR